MGQFRQGMMSTIGMFLLNNAVSQFGPSQEDHAQRHYERKISRKGIGGMVPPKNGAAECFRRRAQIEAGELREQNGLFFPAGINNVYTGTNKEIT